MPITFFNFGNDETFHFFTWVVESGQVDVEAMIAKAFKVAETDEWLAMGLDVCEVVRNKLTDLLSEELERASDVSYETYEVGIVWNSPEALCLPILAIALERINCQAVAQALLLRAGKWAPSKERPEAI